MPVNHFERYDRLDSLPPMVKESIANIVNSDEYLIHYNWLEIVESSCLKLGYQPCYIVGFRGQVVMGMAVNFILPGFRVKNGRAQKGSVKLSVGILPLSNDTNIFLRNQEFRDIFMAGYLALLHKGYLPTVYISLPLKKNEASFEKVIKRKYIKRNYYPSSYLKINFVNFEQYLKQLKSLKRKNVLRAIERFENSGCYFEYCETPGQFQDRLYELLKNVAQKNINQGSPFLLERSTFKLLESKMKGHFHLILAKKGDDIIGFNLIFEKNNIFDNRVIGLDYHYVKSTAVYFNLYYESIKLAINRKIYRIEMSITQMHVKKRLGCEIIQHHAFITTSYNWMTWCADMFGMVPDDRFRDLSQT